MKALNFLLLLLLSFLFSCKNNCEGIDCLSAEAFAFTIKSAETGEDLLFGNNAQLEQNDVEVHYLRNGAKEAAQVHISTSYIEVYLEKGIREYFIFARDKTDTIQVNFIDLPSSECCPSTRKIEQITVNDLPTSEDTWPIELYR